MPALDHQPLVERLARRDPGLAGTTVIWHNSDSVTHTVTSDTGLFDSPLPGGADFQFTFDKAGTYPYYCRPHGGPGEQGMSGTIVVQ
jgi:plastocyanin